MKKLPLANTLALLRPLLHFNPQDRKTEHKYKQGFLFIEIQDLSSQLPLSKGINEYND
jgi:hypothetical protein